MESRVNITNLKAGEHDYPTENIKTLDRKDITLIFAFCIVFIIGVIGNMLVVYLFKFKNRKTLTTMESLILILALADLTSSILNPFMFIYWQVTLHKAWHFGVLGCKILPSLTRITVSFSIAIILIITADRCLVICKPFEQQLKYYQILILVTVALILSILLELPYTIYQEVNPLTTCQVPDSAIPGFAYPIIIIYTLRDFLFLFVFSVTVYFIYKELYNKEHIETLRAQTDTSKTKKIVVMLVTMAVIFTIFVFPRDILHIAFMISWLAPPGIPYTKSFLDTNSFLKVLHMCNSICNVFIYARLHGKFQRRLLRLFKQLSRTGARLNEVTIDEGTQITFDFVQSMYRSSHCENRVTKSFPMTFHISRLQREITKAKYAVLNRSDNDYAQSHKITVL